MRQRICHLSCLVLLCCHLGAAEWPLGVIGEIESVGIVAGQTILAARIDTGATTSSINAQNIQHFERDGHKWVRFDLGFVADNADDGAAPLTIEKKAEKTVKIKRHGTEAQERTAIYLTIIMGDQVLERLFTLADRSDYDFPVLIGRNVLSGQAAVDVSKKNTLKTRLPEQSDK